MTQILSSSLTILIQKYNLDISIVEVKNIRESRLDSDFYSISRKDFDESKDFKNLVDFTDFIKKGIFDISPSNYVQESWVSFIRSWDLKDSFVWWEWVIQINKKSHLQEIKTELEIGDMLISKVWTIWDVALNLDYEKLNFSQNVIWIKVKSEYKKISGYLMAFLNSKPWRGQIERKISWQVQFKITLEDIRTLKIALPTPTFQSRIAELVQEAHLQRKLSKSLYAEAEQILLTELGLIDWTPTEVGIAEKMSEEVRLFGRCDAEFFQPKYDEIIEKIKIYRWWYDTIENLISIAWKQMKIEDDKEYQYCELADIDPSLWIVRNFTKILWTDLPSRARMKIEKWDVVVSSVAGSCEKIALIQSEDTNLVASTGFFVLKPMRFNTETNLILMKSFFMKMFLERSARGMILSATNQEDFKNIIIPDIPPNIQSLISEKITTSHTARDKSKTLLERAKRAVEIFIEEDEESAERFLKKQI